MPLIAEPVLDEIQSRTDIAELIGRYLPLKRAGRHFKGLCPFHKERTPSFHVNTDKQIFHCFGCGVGGNIFSFLMQQERLTFPEAVRQLAEQTGIEIPEPTRGPSDGQTEKLLAILEKACRYYERVLAHPKEGRVARAYLRGRGVADQTRQTFRLGCAPMDGWDRLLQAAKRTALTPAQLEQAGLVIQRERGPIDRFRQRLVFPIHDVRGRILGFGGRSLAEQEPKYLNSPETALYSKGRHLFGLFQAKEAIVKAKSALVVEGYFDCALVAQAGVTHVVSPLGTAFTPEQARLLRRYTDRVVLAFDADAAGEAAALRGMDVLVEAGFHVQVAQLPSGVDPDELVQSKGVEALRQLIDQALSVSDFLIACAKKRYDVRGTDGKVQAAQFVLPTVARVPNAMLRVEYVRLIAEQLKLDEAAVTEELRKVKPRVPQPLAARTPARPQARLQGAEQMLTALVLDQPSRWDAIRALSLIDEVSDGRLRQLLITVGQIRSTQEAEPTPAQVISRLAEPEGGALVSELVEMAQSVADRDGAWRDCVKRLQASGRKRQLAELRQRLGEAQDGGRESDVVRLLNQYQRLVKDVGEEKAHGAFETQTH